MKSIQRFSLWAVILLLACSTWSCRKYLDIVPDNVGTLDYAFRNRNEAENYLFGCYSTLQSLHDVTRNVGFTTSSEVIYPILEIDYFNSSGFNLIRGVQSSGNPILDYWNGQNHGLKIYEAIRRCNIMLENIDQPIDLKEPEKQRWIAEVNFLKAYYHYYLIRLYGPVVLVKENNPIDADIKLTKRKRATLDESFSYVLELLDQSIDGLPDKIENRVQEFGRITKFIALSVKAEVLATAASPLFNGNPDYRGLTDKDGVLLFPQQYDAQKWVLAAQACKLAIQECEKQGLRLSTESPTSGIGTVSDEMKEILALQNIITQRWEENPELIWALNYGFAFQGYTMPKLTSKAVGMANTYPSNWAVPIQMAELYHSENGVPIQEDKTFDYANRHSPKMGDQAHSHYLKEGYQSAGVHFHREKRFYASLGFDGGIWFGNGRQDESNALHVEARGIFATAGPKSLNSVNITGYWPKKLNHYLTVMDETYSTASFQLPIIRLAGLYLLYAEALNEVQGPSNEAYEYLDRVRFRAGLPGVQESWSTYSKLPGKVTTQEGLREIIHRETRIELSFEGQSGWNLRRWKELQEVLNRPLQGWNIHESEPVDYYRPQNVLIPVFGQKDYLWPISTYDLIINENLVQNPYW